MACIQLCPWVQDQTESHENRELWIEDFRSAVALVCRHIRSRRRRDSIHWFCLKNTTNACEHWLPESCSRTFQLAYDRLASPSILPQADKTPKGQQRSLNYLASVLAREPREGRYHCIAAPELEQAFMSCIVSGHFTEATLLGEELLSSVFGNGHLDQLD